MTISSNQASGKNFPQELKNEIDKKGKKHPIYPFFQQCRRTGYFNRPPNIITNQTMRRRIMTITARVTRSKTPFSHIV